MRTFYITKYIFLHILCFTFITAHLYSQVKPGIDVLATQHPEIIIGKTIALLTSKSSLDINLTHTIDRLSKATNIKLIVTGDVFFRETMKGDDGDEYDVLTNSKVVIYSDPSVKPTNISLSGIDALVIDIQDIGIRYFKYLTIMAQLLELAKNSDVPVILLDRPNPIGGKIVSGFVLKLSLRSRFGVYPIPLIYGMTIGELALYFNKIFGIGSNLTVIGMEKYNRQFSYKETGLHWIPPFDHVNEGDTPIYYAVTGILGEMGVFSTGVGTTRRFRYILAPWIDGEILSDLITKLNLPGLSVIPTTQTPYYGLFANKKINGVELIITDKSKFDPFKCCVAFLKTLYDLYPQQIPLKNHTVSEALDILVGNEAMREGILKGQSIETICDSVKIEQTDFLNKRQQFLIYPE